MGEKEELSSPRARASGSSRGGMGVSELFVAIAVAGAVLHIQGRRTRKPHTRKTRGKKRFLSCPPRPARTDEDADDAAEARRKKNASMENKTSKRGSWESGFVAVTMI